MSVRGLILAAGKGSRFGGSKLTQPLAGSSVIQCTVRFLLPFCETITVVIGCYADAVAAAVSPVAGVTIVPNPGYRAGMFSSVLTGILALPEESDLLLVPGDMPLVQKATCRTLLDCGREKGRICIPVYGEKHGHPVFIPSAVVEQLRRADPSWNLRDFLYAEGFEAIPVDDAGVLLDIDTREDYQKLADRGLSSPRFSGLLPPPG